MITRFVREPDRRSFLTRVAAGLLGPVTVGSGPSAVSAWTGARTNSVLNQARTDASPLKITRVTPYVLRVHRDAEGRLTGNHYLMCRVDTDEAITGWGEGTNFPKVATIATEIEMIRPMVVGQSAWDIEKIWHTIYRARNAMHGSAVQSAISAIDIALWDIVGQKLGVPLYKLLGGKVNERLRIYTSYRWGEIPRTAEAYARKTRELIAAGAVAGKWDPFPDSQVFNGDVGLRTLHEVVEMVRGIREAGPEFEICVEAHAKFNIHAAIRIAKSLEPFDLMWLEEPVPPLNADAMVQVQRATSVPIAAGERLKSRLQAREYIERDAFRVYQPDAARCGGITEFRKLIAMAESHFIPFAPHNANGPVCLAAHLHLSAASASFLIFEEGDTNPALNRELFGSWHDSLAYFVPPDRPGLGLRFSEAFLRDHSVPLDRAERG